MQIIESSATPAQVYNLTLAFQRTAGLGLPPQITDTPTVKVAGSAMWWTSPSMSLARVTALLAEFDRLERGVFGGPTAEDEHVDPERPYGPRVGDLVTLIDSDEAADYAERKGLLMNLNYRVHRVFTEDGNTYLEFIAGGDYLAEHFEVAE